MFHQGRTHGGPRVPPPWSLKTLDFQGFSFKFGTWFASLQHVFWRFLLRGRTEEVYSMVKSLRFLSHFIFGRRYFLDTKVRGQWSKKDAIFTTPKGIFFLSVYTLCKCMMCWTVGRGRRTPSGWQRAASCRQGVQSCRKRAPHAVAPHISHGGGKAAICALCLTTNALCHTAKIGALLLKCVLIVYILPEIGVYYWYITLNHSLSLSCKQNNSPT